MDFFFYYLIHSNKIINYTIKLHQFLSNMPQSILYLYEMKNVG